MQEGTLLILIGEVPLSELSAAEKAAILNTFDESQIGEATLRVFDLLRKKFQPNYRMGKMYEELSQKYEFYNRLYNQCAQTVRAGKLGHTNFTEQITLNGNKFRED